MNAIHTVMKRRGMQRSSKRIQTTTVTAKSNSPLHFVTAKIDVIANRTMVITFPYYPSNEQFDFQICPEVDQYKYHFPGT